MTTVESKNQSGGVTAQSVHVGNRVPKQESAASNLFWWLFGFAGFIAAIASVYAIFF